MFSFRLLSLAPLALAAVLPRDEAINYDGYKVFHISTQGNSDAVLSALSSLNYDQWNYQLDDHIDISVAGEDVAAFEALALNYTVMHEDLGADIAEEARPAAEDSSLSRRQSSTYFNSYHSYNEHITFWSNLQTSFPSNTERFVAGRSFENREIFGYRLFGRNTGAVKPALIWHGTVHAREWITTMTVEYLANEILNGYRANDATFRSWLDTYDIYILPVVNPDGFVFSQTTNRLWRKQRTPVTTNGRTCIGTDINRNWPYQWTGDPNGASTNPCAETYKGRAAGDTPENRALVNHTLSVSNRQPIALYLDFHSYGNYLLSPYGYTNSQPANGAAQVSLARRAATAIEGVSGTAFTTGPSGSTLYPTTGSSCDYVTDVARARYCYVFELRDNGENGFVLPPAQILPVGREILAGMRVLIGGL